MVTIEKNKLKGSMFPFVMIKGGETTYWTYKALVELKNKVDKALLKYKNENKS